MCDLCWKANRQSKKVTSTPGQSCRHWIFTQYLYICSDYLFLILSSPNNDNLHMVLLSFFIYINLISGEIMQVSVSRGWWHPICYIYWHKAVQVRVWWNFRLSNVHYVCSNVIASTVHFPRIEILLLMWIYSKGPYFMKILLRIWLLMLTLNKMIPKRVRKTMGNLTEKHQKS